MAAEKRLIGGPETVIPPQLDTSVSTITLKELGLTARPGEVLTRILHGQDLPQISKEMGIKSATLYRYLYQIHRALGVQTTIQAIVRAYELGFEVSYPEDDNKPNKEPLLPEPD